MNESNGLNDIGDPVLAEEDVENQFVAFIETLSDRMDAVEVKNNKMDKALASSLRAIASLVQDIVVVIDPLTSDEIRSRANGRINKFIETVKSMDAK